MSHLEAYKQKKSEANPIESEWLRSILEHIGGDEPKKTERVECSKHGLHQYKRITKATISNGKGGLISQFTAVYSDGVRRLHFMSKCDCGSKEWTCTDL